MNRIQTEVREILEKLNGRENIIGVLLLNNKGQVLQSTLSSEDITQLYAQCVQNIINNAVTTAGKLDQPTTVRALNMKALSQAFKNATNFLRIQLNAKELLIVYDPNFSLTAIQELVSEAYGTKKHNTNPSPPLEDQE